MPPSIMLRMDRLGRWLSSHTLHHRSLLGYLLAIALMLIALGVRLLIAPVNVGLQYVTFFPAVTLAAVIAGLRPALLATLLGVIFATVIFTPPYWDFALESWYLAFWPNLVFMMDGGIVAFSIDAMHRYRRQYQEELAESQHSEQELQLLLKQREADYLVLQKFAAIIQSTEDAIISKSLDGIIESWNPAAERIFGYSAAEVLGRSMLLLIPVERQSEESEILARIARGERIEHYETVRRCKDGRLIHVAASMSPVRNAEGEIVGVAKVARDVSREKEQEQKLLEAKERAEQASRIKTSFLASMSHEIRTPLGGMLGMLELLSMSHLDAEQTATLDTAWASGRGLLRIVNDILDWSKIEEGKLEITPVPTALGGVLQEVVNTYSRVASSKSLTVWQHVDTRLVNVYSVDPLRLSQVLNNFVSNAIKFTERGEIELRADLLEERAAGDLIRFSVRDTGIGIAAEDQEKLFESYAQASTSTARMYGGTGLGLAICRRLAEMMGGEIELSSAPGRGSTFSMTLLLPRSDSVAEMAAPRVAEVAQRMTPVLFDNQMDAPLVLVVDDHPTNRELLARQIKLLGLRTRIAENGRVGVSLWRDGRFAMVITDCHMPDMDGYEMTRSIRKIEAQEGRPRTPVIAWTANALPEEQARILEAGMDELLVKPVGLAQLRAMLAKWFKPEEKPAAAAASAPDVEAQVVPIDYSLLDLIVTDRTEQKQVLRDFMAHIRGDRAKLGEELAAGDSAAVKSVAHRMKGSCNMVGATILGGICAEMEQTARRGELPEMQAFDVALEQLVAFLG